VVGWVSLGNVDGVRAIPPQSSATATPPASGNTSPATDPQPRYRDGRSSQTTTNSPSAPNAAAPRPPQEPYLRNSFDRIQSYLPELGAGLVVLVVGILIAYFVRFILLRVLSRTGLDALLERNGIISRSALSLLQDRYEPEAAARRRASIRNSEPYQSYFGRSPARRWHPEESISYAPPSIGIERTPSPSQDASESDVTRRNIEGGSSPEHHPIFERKTESFSEERYSFDAGETAERPSVSADAQRFLEQEEFDPERHLAQEIQEQAAPQPRLRRATDRYRIRVGTRVVANTVFWIIVIAALMEACRAARLYGFASGLEDILGYVPHLIAGFLIFIGSILVANWVRDRLVGGDPSTASLVGGAVKAGILTIGGFMALRELQIAPDIVKIAFTLAFGAIALATALALGLGSRKVAEQMTSEIYDENSSKLREFGRRLRRGSDRAA